MIKGVILYKCNRNVNRVYRLCYIYGVKQLFIVDGSIPDKIGNVFSAKDKVSIIKIDNLNNINGKIVAFEKGGKSDISEVNKADYILIGGESQTINKKQCDTLIGIKTPNNLCLTVDQALAIGLNYATR